MTKLIKTVKITDETYNLIKKISDCEMGLDYYKVIHWAVKNLAKAKKIKE